MMLSCVYMTCVHVKHVDTANRAPNMPMHYHQVLVYPFARFPSCGIFTPTRTSPVKQLCSSTSKNVNTANFTLKKTVEVKLTNLTKNN